MPELIANVCATLRRFGQDALASEYSEAFDRWLATIDTVAICRADVIYAAESGEVDAAVEAAVDRADTAGDANDAAAIEFYRLTAEIYALTDGARGADTKGGAEIRKCRACKQDMSIATSCTAQVEGRVPYARIRRFDDGTTMQLPERCHDCGVQVGGLHHPGCDMEDCPVCGAQAISCDCDSVARRLADATWAPNGGAA